MFTIRKWLLIIISLCSGCQSPNNIDLSHPMVDDVVEFSGIDNKLLKIDIKKMEIFTAGETIKIFDCGDQYVNCLTDKSDILLITPKSCIKFDLAEYINKFPNLQFYGLNLHGSEIVMVESKNGRFGYSFSHKFGISELYDARKENLDIRNNRNIIEKFALTKRSKFNFFNCVA